jgi:hypothetical protein
MADFKIDFRRNAPTDCDDVKFNYNNFYCYVESSIYKILLISLGCDI